VRAISSVAKNQVYYQSHNKKQKNDELLESPNQYSRFSQSNLTEWDLGCGWSAAPTNHTPKFLFFPPRLPRSFCGERRESV
jgi:hypothetical protein